MITLRDVIKIGDTISLSYSYFDEYDKGYLKYSIEKGDYTEIVYNKADQAKKNIKYPFGKIIRILRQMVEYNNYPETVNYYWY